MIATLPAVTAQAPTPAPPADDDDEAEAHKSNIGAIVGGTVGGVVGLALVLGLIWWLTQRDLMILAALKAARASWRKRGSEQRGKDMEAAVGMDGGGGVGGDSGHLGSKEGGVVVAMDAASTGDLHSSVLQRCIAICEDLLSSGLRVIANQARCQQLVIKAAALLPMLQQLRLRELTQSPSMTDANGDGVPLIRTSSADVVPNTTLADVYDTLLACQACIHRWANRAGLAALQDLSSAVCSEGSDRDFIGLTIRMRDAEQQLTQALSTRPAAVGSKHPPSPFAGFGSIAAVASASINAFSFKHGFAGMHQNSRDPSFGMGAGQPAPIPEGELSAGNGAPTSIVSPFAATAGVPASPFAASAGSGASPTLGIPAAPLAGVHQAGAVGPTGRGMSSPFDLAGAAGPGSLPKGSAVPGDGMSVADEKKSDLMSFVALVVRQGGCKDWAPDKVAELDRSCSLNGVDLANLVRQEEERLLAQLQREVRRQAVAQRMAALEYIRPMDIHGLDGLGSQPVFMGRGGFGSVYRGVWQGEPVAVKKLDSLGVRNAAEEFAREAYIMSSCKHPNIAQIFGLAKDPTTGMLSIVMRYYERGSLRDVLEDIAHTQLYGGDASKGGASHRTYGPDGHTTHHSTTQTAGNSTGLDAAGQPWDDGTGRRGAAATTLTETPSRRLGGAGLAGLTLAHKLQMALDVARAMAYLHGRPHELIVHGDLKPGNVLVDSALRCYVSDFGMATMKTSTRTLGPASQANSFFYSAPEVLEAVAYEGDPTAPDAPSTKRTMDGDVYSYGMMLYELFTGRPPFDGANGAQVLALILNGRRPVIPAARNDVYASPADLSTRPHTLEDGVPLPIAHIIEACWEQNPLDRPVFSQVTLAIEAAAMALQVQLDS